MSYQNPYLSPYGMMPQYQQPVQPVQVVKVSGENGARAYQMGANSSALLLDESGLMVWLVTSDGAGYKTVSSYDITPHKVTPAPDYGTLENRIKRLEDIINGNSRNTSAACAKQSDDAILKADDRNGKQFTEPNGRPQSANGRQPADETGDGYREQVWR